MPESTGSQQVPIIGAPTSNPNERGRHKVFLGYAAGTGKTFAMLDEARRRLSRGQDVVVGIVDTHGRKDTLELVQGFESIKPLEFNVNGQMSQELDTEAIIARKPQLVLVDELQHRNAPGSRREQRWADVDALLDAGINVLSTLDVQHLESLNDQVHDIAGIRITDTVPDSVLALATEVEFVDATPRALIHRLERGDVFTEEQGKQQARETMFKEGSLSALRELALREVAEHVDEDVLEHRGESKVQRPWAARDRVMICLSPTQPSLRLLRRGWRTGQRLHAEVVAVLVEEETPSPREQKIIEDDFKLAERLGIPTVRLKGDAAHELIEYAKANGITQLVIGHSSRSRMQEIIRPSIVGTLVKELRTIDILVVAADKSLGSD